MHAGSKSSYCTICTASEIVELQSASKQLVFGSLAEALVD